MSNQDLENLGKPFSDMCFISENEKTFQNAIRWCIPNNDIKKQLESSSKPIQSNKFSIGSSFCSFYILFRANMLDSVDEKDCYIKDYLKSLSADIIFNSKLPDSAWIKGKIHFDELNIGETFSVSAHTFQKKKETIISCNSSDFEKLIHICEKGQDLTMYCSLKVILREVKCTFDKKGMTYTESRDYDQNKEINHDFSDVSISIGDHLFMTHKVLLARIPYFHKLFDSNESENHIELTDIDHEIFNNVLTYLYYGEIPKLSFKLACQLYIVASDLEISDLKSMCSSYLGANLNYMNVLVTLKLSHEYGDTTLKNECFKFVKRSDAEELTKKSIII